MADPAPTDFIPGRGFDPSQWNDATRQAVAAWEAAHPGYKLDGSQKGWNKPATTPPPGTTPPGTTPPGTTPGTGTNPGGLPSLTDLIAQLTGAMPSATLPEGTSDPLSQAYLQSQTQRAIAALTQAAGLT